MPATDIELHAYLDIATSIASQGRQYREFLSSKWGGLRTDVAAKDQDSLVSEWSRRIQAWLKETSNGSKRLKEGEKLKDADFRTFFLEHPIPAMQLWNVMQELYELDRLVCGASNTADETLAGWESTEIFYYLKSRKVEEKWKKSLEAVSRMDGSMQTESWKADIQYGVSALNEAWEELQRSFAQSFKGSKPPASLVKEIGEVVQRRLSMIDNSLRSGRNVATIGSVSKPIDSKYASGLDKLSELGTTFKPLNCVNSMGDIRKPSVISTLKEIFFLFLLLVGLYQVQWFLDTL